MLEIRNAVLEDIPMIRELTFRIWPETYAVTLTKEQIAYMLEMMYSEVALTRQMTEENCSFILVFDNGNPVGFASFSEVENRKWKLHKIYILTSEQGKGTGRFVIDHIIKTISVHGADSLQLQVNRYNKAKDFYEKLGFTVIKTADFDIGNGFFMNDYVMEKNIGT